MSLARRDRRMRIPRSAVALALAAGLATGGCAPAVRAAAPVSAPAAAEGEAWVADRLYFGRNIRGGGTVSEAEWKTFVDEVVTPRFSSGITVLHADGQWRDSMGVVIPEASFVLERLHPPGPEADAAVAAIAAEYKRRFRQESVMHVRAPAAVRFHEED